MTALAHSLDLPFSEPYDVAALLAAQRTHAVAGIDAPEPSATAASAERESEDAAITRGISHDGRRGILRAVFHDDHVRATSTLPIDDALAQRIRRWLDLDADPRRVAEAFAGDPVIAPLVARRPGLRIFGHIDDLEAVCFAVLGQQVSLASARTFQRRFVAEFGELDPETGYRHLPDAATLAGHSPQQIRDAIGLTRSRAATLHSVAAALADGLELNGDPAGIRSRLLSLKGIGPWTADYLAVRAVGDRDAFPAGDLVLRRAMGAEDAASATAAGEVWRPLRAYATFHLWTEHAYCAPASARL